MIAEYDVAARAPASSRVASWSARLAVPAVALAVSVWVESARFGLKTPSLIDEWFGVAYSRPALHALLHGKYLSAGSDFAGRYRPGYTAIWNSIQWHLLGAPSMAASTAWGVVRAAGLFFAVWLLAKFLIGRRESVPRPFVLLAPLAVLLTPQIAVAVARFGPGEPMMVTGVVLGVALLAKGIGILLSDRAVRARRARGVAFLVGGYLVYLLGVYSKESSVALLAGAPFFAMWLRPALVRFAGRSRAALSAVIAAAVLLLAPPFHVALHLVLAVLRGTSPWPNAHLSTGAKIYAAAASPLLGVPGVLGTWLWFFASMTALALVIALARRRERDAWLLIGVLATGYLASAIPLARGPMPTWYYIPWIVAVAGVSFRAVTRANPRPRLLVVAVVAVLVPINTPAALAEWTHVQQSGSQAISLSKGVLAANCELYLANFDIEQRVAIPLLFRFGTATPVPRCGDRADEAYAVSWKNKPLGRDLMAGCAHWTRVSLIENVGFYRCPAFRSSFPFLNQNAASGEPTVTVVRVRLPARDPKPAEIFQPLPHH